jgi:hypothetical protein
MAKLGSVGVVIGELRIAGFLTLLMPLQPGLRLSKSLPKRSIRNLALSNQAGQLTQLMAAWLQ